MVLELLCTVDRLHVYYSLCEAGKVVEANELVVVK